MKSLYIFKHITEKEDFMTKNKMSYRLNFNHLALTLGYKCNFRCRSCLLGDKLKDGSTEISYENAIKLIDSAAELRTVNVVAFVGGEPFLYYRKMIDIADYLWINYRCGLSISTNGYWATSYQKARELLTPLYERGLRWMLVSLDDFHLEFTKLDTIVNCLNAAIDMGIRCSVQSILITGSRSTTDFKKLLAEKCDIERIASWVDNACVPVGNAATRISRKELKLKQGIPIGGCSIGRALNVQPDGSVKPCCGAGLMADALTVGNAYRKSFKEIVNEMESNPITNAIITWKGPYYLAELLKEQGYSKFIKRKFVDSCHACYEILSDRKALEVLQNLLKEDKEIMALLASRLISENPEHFLSNQLSGWSQA